jgi:hypothetical protein
MSISNKYKYNTINEMKTDGDYNFYGVIYDASFPVQEDNKQNPYANKDNQNPVYICYLKLIDPTVNCITNPFDLNEEIIHLIIKSSCKENLPYLHNIGDIIRVHRGVFVIKLNKKENLNSFHFLIKNKIILMRQKNYNLFY